MEMKMHLTFTSDLECSISERTISGKSVGVEVIDGKRENGVYRVLKSKMEETSLVQAAAFKSAEVLSVAASEDDAAKEITTQNESEAVVEDTTNAVAVAADNETTTAPGMVPTRQLTEVINPLSNADRPYVDAISRGTLPDAGMTFEIPKITAVPIVDQIDENQAIADSQLTASYLSVSVKPFKGRAITTVELIDRSSPVFFDELVRQMEFAYAKETSNRVLHQVAF